MTGDGPRLDGLERRAAESAEAEQFAALAVATWRAIDRELTPIIGARGFAAVYQRSLFLTPGSLSALSPAQGDAEPADPFEALRLALLRLSGADARSANAALLQTFRDLLVSLIGSALTERLLRPVWTPPANGTTVQDPIR